MQISRLGNALGKPGKVGVSEECLYASWNDQPDNKGALGGEGAGCQVRGLLCLFNDFFNSFPHTVTDVWVVVDHAGYSRARNPR